MCRKLNRKTLRIKYRHGMMANRYLPPQLVSFVPLTKKRILTPAARRWQSDKRTGNKSNHIFSAQPLGFSHSHVAPSITLPHYWVVGRSELGEPSRIWVTFKCYNELKGEKRIESSLKRSVFPGMSRKVVAYSFPLPEGSSFPLRPAGGVLG